MDDVKGTDVDSIELWAGVSNATADVVRSESQRNVISSSIGCSGFKVWS